VARGWIRPLTPSHGEQGAAAAAGWRSGRPAVRSGGHRGVGVNGFFLRFGLWRPGEVNVGGKPLLTQTRQLRGLLTGPTNACEWGNEMSAPARAGRMIPQRLSRHLQEHFRGGVRLTCLAANAVLERQAPLENDGRSARSHLAKRVGVAVLKKGGNEIDARRGCGLCLAVWSIPRRATWVAVAS